MSAGKTIAAARAAAVIGGTDGMPASAGALGGLLIGSLGLSGPWASTSRG